MKLTVSKSKNSASFYVQKTIRKSNGSVTTVTVEKLGNLDEVKAKPKDRILTPGHRNTSTNSTAGSMKNRRK